MSAGSTLEFQPVTSANWDDFEALFEASGGPKYCWCMVWRVNAEAPGVLSVNR